MHDYVSYLSKKQEFLIRCETNYLLSLSKKLQIESISKTANGTETRIALVLRDGGFPGSTN